jgi:molecular chaperone DnaJ
MPRDYYDVLGLQRSANQDEIKRAFRKKAHELHPDKGGDEKSFKEVNEAYQILGDSKKKTTYDQFGHAAFQGAGAGPGGFGGFGGFSQQGVNINMDDLGDLGDVLGSMFGFGGRSGKKRQKRGRDVETTLNLSFMEAFRGVNKDIPLRIQTTCESCKGSGALEGSKTVTCSECKGQGSVVRAQRTPFGTFQHSTVCAICQGKGSRPENICSSCSGNGVYIQTKTIQIQIPAGIDDGETVRVSGSGEVAPHGGSAGDLYVHVRVTKHPKFVRRGNEVLSDAYIPMTAFALGGKVDIETVEGKVELKVPTGTQSGTVFKLRGKGFPYLHGRGKGDHLVTLYPDIPTKLSREQKKLLDELSEIGL